MRTKCPILGNFECQIQTSDIGTPFTKEGWLSQDRVRPLAYMIFWRSKSFLKKPLTNLWYTVYLSGLGKGLSAAAPKAGEGSEANW